jgi:hypothetical protein
MMLEFPPLLGPSARSPEDDNPELNSGWRDLLRHEGRLNLATGM